jgi:urease accessory protein
MSDAGAVVAMLLADARFPSGGHAHSLGLEEAVAGGLRADEVPAFAAARLELVAAPEAAMTVVARRAAAGADLDALATLDAEHAARTPSPVLREHARRLGAGLLRSAGAVWPDGVLTAYRSRSRAVPRPVALGVVGAAAGLGDEHVAAVALYDDAAAVASAALKLLPLDPAVAASWVAELAGRIAALASRAVRDAARPPADLPAPAAVALERAAHAHARRKERLFVS